MMQRRDFLKKGTAASLAISGFPYLMASERNRKFKTALIGSGWWGMNILRCAMALGDIRTVALCDADKNQMAKAADEVAKLSGEKPRLFADYREMLQKTKPDIVIVATPDHWHALNAIEALAQGAHVYLEKPIAHTIQEGTAIVRAARESGRVVQVGMHRSLSPHNLSGIEFIRSGKVGKIGLIRAFVHYNMHFKAPAPNALPPEGLDWDLWCGPAPLVPYNPGIHPRGFRQYLDFANGQLGDWGVHWFDQVLRCTEERHPKRVFSTGGRAVRNDHTDAPDHQTVVYEFETFQLIWEHRLFNANHQDPHQLGVYFYGTQGTFHMGWLDGWSFYPSDKNQSVISQPAQLHEPDSHNIPELWADFIRAIRERKEPAVSAQMGKYATDLSLLGMLSWKLGRSVEWDGEAGRFPDDEAANAMLSRPYRAPWVYPL